MIEHTLHTVIINEHGQIEAPRGVPCDVCGALIVSGDPDSCCCQDCLEWSVETALKWYRREE